MRDLIVTEFISLDGVIEAPGGEPGYAHSGWVGPRFSDELGEYKLQEQLAAETMLLGRTTYESFYGAWPLRDGPMAEKINTMEKLVASRTQVELEWSTASLLSNPVEDAVIQLKQRDGGPILIAGSRSLVQTLMAAGLIDEYHLQVFPVILGSGMRLYPDTPDMAALTLVDSRAIEHGVTLQTYRSAAA